MRPRGTGQGRKERIHLVSSPTILLQIEDSGVLRSCREHYLGMKMCDVHGPSQSRPLLEPRAPTKLSVCPDLIKLHPCS